MYTEHHNARFKSKSLVYLCHIVKKRIYKSVSDWNFYYGTSQEATKIGINEGNSEVLVSHIKLFIPLTVQF